MALLLLDTAPLAQPWRGILLTLVIAGVPAILLTLAISRMKSRNRPRHLRIQFSDRDALIYQVTKILSMVGFSQGPRDGQAILFQPNGPQKLFGMAPIELLFDQPAAARLTATHGIMRRVAHNFRGAREEKFTGKTSFPLKGFAIAFAILLGTMVIFIGVFALTNRNSLPPGPGGGTSINRQDLDVEQVLNITPDQATRGANIDVNVAHSTMPFNVQVPAKTTEGTRLRFNGMGKSPPQGGVAGDFYLRIHIQ